MDFTVSRLVLKYVTFYISGLQHRLSFSMQFAFLENDLKDLGNPLLELCIIIYE